MLCGQAYEKLSECEAATYAPDKWIIHDVPDLRIVAQDLWNSVKARQIFVGKNTRPDSRQNKPFWEKTRYIKLI